MRIGTRSYYVVSALVIAFIQVVGSFGAASNQPAREQMDVLAVVLVLAGPLALSVRDRWPLVSVGVSLAAAATYVGLEYAYGPIFLSVVVALVSAVLSGHRRGAWVLAGSGYVAFLVAASLHDDSDDTSRPMKYAVVAGWLLVVLAVAEAVRNRRDTAAQRARADAEARRRAEGDQRLELAQELHDVLAHHISLINVQASVALHLLDDQPERARPALTEIKAASREALLELRSALDLLRGDADEADSRRELRAAKHPAPRLADLGQLVATVAASGLDVHLDAPAPPANVPDAVALAAYRIVQEALTNVSRHANAHHAVVTVRYGDAVQVEIVDDGVGGDAVAGHGITGMRARATALGGTFEAAPRPDGGFRVVARLPVLVGRHAYA